MKLERGGLASPFGFGGYGSDHEDRAELLRAGARRGAARIGQPLEACRIVVIGDTPKDVAAAHAIGAVCIGVGTGGHTASSLRELGAHTAVDDLRDPVVLDVIVG